MTDTPAGTTTDHHQPADTDASLRVLVIDDHALVHSGVRSKLTARAPDLDIITEADDAEGAIATVYALRSDAILLDVHLPGGNGGGGAEVVAPCHDVPETRFLALSASDAGDDVVGVIQAGACGYVTKMISIEDLAQAVRRVAARDAAFSPRLAGFVLDAFGARVDGVVVANTEFDHLSTREWEVIRLIAHGYTYKECTSELFISVKAVGTHISAVLHKLQLPNHSELAHQAMARRVA